MDEATRTAPGHPDPLGRAVRDHHRGERTAPLVDRDGDRRREHRIEAWYLGRHDPDAWRDRYLEGPLVDLGAGAGRDARYYQRDREVVALDVSPALVETMADRGVEDPRLGDMFALTEQFPPDRFRSAHAIGTQLGLAGSMAGVEAFLEALATVTTADATAVLDGYAPAAAAAADVFAYRDDPAPGLGHRVYHETYEGIVGRTLLLRVFDVDRLRAAAADTPWTVVDVRELRVQWRAALRKTGD